MSKKEITKVYINGGLIEIRTLEKYVSYKATKYIGLLKVTKMVYPGAAMEMPTPTISSNSL